MAVEYARGARLSSLGSGLATELAGCHPRHAVVGHLPQANPQPGAPGVPSTPRDMFPGVCALAQAVEQIAKVASGLAQQSKALEEMGGGLLGRLPGGLLARRSVEIWGFIAEITAKMSLANRAAPDELQARRQAVSEDLCAGLLRLGPTFIKLGQVCPRVLRACTIRARARGGVTTPMRFRGSTHGWTHG